MAWQFYRFTDHSPTVIGGFKNPHFLQKATEFLKSLGSIETRRSGDATTYSSNSDIVDEGEFEVTRAHESWGNAYFELSAQKGSSATTGRIKVCFDVDTFATGATANTTGQPAAGSTHEVVLLGAGSDATPTYGTIFALSDDNTDLYVVAMDAAPWSWIVIGINKSGASNASSTVIFFDALTNTHPDDAVPCVAYWNAQQSCLLDTRLTSLTTGPVGWLAKGLGGEGLVRIAAANWSDSGQTAIPGHVGLDPFDGAVQLFPVSYARSDVVAAPNGFKGTSTLLAWHGSAVGTVKTGTRLKDIRERVGSETAADSAALVKWMVVDHCVVPWNGTVGSPNGTALAADPSAGAIMWARVRNVSVPQTDDDTVAPVVNVTASPVTNSDPFVVEVYDAAPGITTSSLWARIGGAGRPGEMIHDGTNFWPRYATRSTRTGTGTNIDPYVYTIHRDGRWPSGVAIDIYARATDGDGNATEED